MAYHKKWLFLITTSIDGLSQKMTDISRCKFQNNKQQVYLYKSAQSQPMANGQSQPMANGQSQLMNVANIWDKTMKRRENKNYNFILWNQKLVR